MKLKSARVHNFRCIDDSKEFSIGDITCLVGKNESGKTSVLKALELINSIEGNKVDKDRDYPRKSLTDFDAASVLTVTMWELSGEDIAAIEAVLGPGSVLDKSFQLSQKYDGGSTWGIKIDESKVIEFLLTQAGCDASERSVLAGLSTVSEVKKKATEIQASTASIRLATLVQKVSQFRDDKAVLAAIDITSKKLPKFLYFAQYDRMNGSVSLEALQKAVSEKKVNKNDEVFLAFLAYAGTSLEEAASLKKYETLTARVESASIKISSQIFKYWSQNKHLKVKFTIDVGRPDDAAPFNSGNIMRTRILNELHQMTVPFDERSAGFVWFFSFLVYFSQIQKAHGNVVILLDEPGLNLHGKAQADLLRFIETELRPKHQVVYTTHSPFMVPADDLASVRTVEDVVKDVKGGGFEVLGTKVGDNVLSTDRDTLFPLQGALGYEITQSLFVGPNTLLVEGPSDILYLQWASAQLKGLKRTGLDPKWVICPTGGIDKVSAFLSLFGGNKLNVAVLTDFATGQKGKVEALKKSALLHSGSIFTTVDFIDQTEADIEDLLGEDCYLAVVNAAYSLTGKEKLMSASLKACGEKSPRIVKQVEAAFRTMKSAPEFDHYLPAQWLLTHPDPGVNHDDALARLEKLFDAINPLLK